MGKHTRLQVEEAAPAKSLRRAPRLRTRYYAFLSYSHKDEALAEWLQHELEQFRVPPALVGRLTRNGVIPKRLKPVFRDEHELAAADDLGEEIEAALASSQFLVVLCSPAAARSEWTNAEVQTFKRTRPEGCILAAIAAGEPFASEVPGREAEECFPPALRQKFDKRGRPTGRRAEPLAADLREEGEERRQGFLKLVAGMLGVGLDELVQRETTQRHRRLAWLTAASLAGMAVTSTLAVTAIQARDAARDQRREAEGLVAFMLGDLKDKLEPIGRLDALDGVGSKVLAYYAKQDAGDLSDAALLQRSRALSLTGQVAYLRGRMTSAAQLYQQAAAGTEEAVRRNSSDPQRLFDHAQNVFWIGEIGREQGRLADAERAYRQYRQLAQKMVALSPDNMKFRMEVQYADANLGIVLYEQRRFAEARAQFAEALQTIESLSAADPANVEYRKSTGLTLAWLADAEMSLGNLDRAIALRQRQVAILTDAARKGDADTREKLVPAEQALGLLYGSTGRLDLALKHLEQAVALSTAMLGVESANTVWLEDSFKARLALADHLGAAGRLADARSQAESGCEQVQRLLRSDPNFPHWRSGMRDCELTRTALALRSGDASSAVADAARAVEAARLVRSSDSAMDGVRLAKAYRLLGDARQRAGDSAGAKAAWSAAAAAFPAKIAERPSETDEHALILQRNGQTAAGRQLEAKLKESGYRTIA